MEFCPICSSKMKVNCSLAGDNVVAEETEDCPQGCYSYEFLYGHTQIFICGVRFHRGYSDDFPRFHDWNLAIMLVVRLHNYKNQCALLEGPDLEERVL